MWEALGIKKQTNRISVILMQCNAESTFVLTDKLSGEMGVNLFDFSDWKGFLYVVDKNTAIRIVAVDSVVVCHVK